MKPSTVTFKDFTITDPERYCVIVEADMPYWPLDWDMVAERSGKEFGTLPYRWLRENCFSKFEIATDSTTGLRVFAFEDFSESALFRLRF